MLLFSICSPGRSTITLALSLAALGGSQALSASRSSTRPDPPPCIDRRQRRRKTHACTVRSLFFSNATNGVGWGKATTRSRSHLRAAAQDASLPLNDLVHSYTQPQPQVMHGERPTVPRPTLVSRSVPNSTICSGRWPSRRVHTSTLPTSVQMLTLTDVGQTEGNCGLM